MKIIKIIEMPKEEVRLDALEKALISAGGNCEGYAPCKTEHGEKLKNCGEYNSNPCSRCGGLLFCVDYSF